VGEVVSCAAVRRKADLEVRRAIDDVREAERARFLNWWYLDDGNRFGMEAELPAAQGAVVARALQRVTDSLPAMPDEEDPSFVEARRADALVALCSTHIADDADPDRAPWSCTLGSATSSEPTARPRSRAAGDCIPRPRAACYAMHGCRPCSKTNAGNRSVSAGSPGSLRLR
jgi:hypothetical protein